MLKDGEVKPTSRDMLPLDQRRALELWETVVDYRSAAFILSNGELLEGVLGEHEEIASSIFPEEEKPITMLLATGAIRISNWSDSANIELVVEPNSFQVEVLKDIFSNAPKIAIDITDGQGKSVKSYSGVTQFGQTINDIRRTIKISRMK